MWLPSIKLINEDGVSGVAVVIVRTDDEWITATEAGRIAFVREQATKKNQGKSFQEQLADVIARADAACEAANDLEAELKRQRELDAEERQRNNTDAIDQGLAMIKDALGGTASKTPA